MPKLTDISPIALGQPDCLTEIVGGLRARGLALVSGLAGREDALALGQALVTLREHRDGGSDGATAIAKRTNLTGRTGMAGFSDQELMPHTEGSALSHPPRILIMACLRPADAGGYSVMIDGREVYEEIAESDAAMLEALCTPRSVYFGAGAGHLGSIFQPHQDGHATVRLRLDDLVRFSSTVCPHLPKLRTLLERHAKTRKLDAGEAYVLQNDRWLHGRTRFHGDRLMLRILGDPLDQHPIPHGFRPESTKASIQSPCQRSA